jgi:hypothetical protein
MVTVRDGQGWSGMVRNGQERSGTVRDGQGWSGWSGWSDGQEWSGTVRDGERSGTVNGQER